jgi:hypothetical protein
VGVPWYERDEGAEPWMWLDWPQCVQDGNMAVGGVDKDSMDRRTTTGPVWPRWRRQARRGTIGRGKEDGKSGASWGGKG